MLFWDFYGNRKTWWGKLPTALSGPDDSGRSREVEHPRQDFEEEKKRKKKKKIEATEARSSSEPKYK
jgi:hypothetical protein